MIRVFDEWSPLRTVVLGDVIPCDVLEPASIWHDPADQDAYRRIVEETREDLARFEAVMTARGITVLRPDVSFANPGEGHPINARDFYFAYGEQGLTTRGSIRAKEPLHFNAIVTDALRAGHLWSSFPAFDASMPPGDRIDEEFIHRVAGVSPEMGDPAFLGPLRAAVVAGDMDKALSLIDANPGFWAGHELDFYVRRYARFALWHAAGVMKFGKHVVIGEAGSSLGRRFFDLWVKSQGGELLHILRGGHIDGGLSFLNDRVALGGRGGMREDLAKRFTFVTSPKKLAFWNFMETNPDRGTLRVPSRWINEWVGYWQEFNADHNALSLAPDCVCLSFFDGEVYKALERLRIEPIFINWRHRVFWEGGLHCITLDLERDGGQVDYLGS